MTENAYKRATEIIEEKEKLEKILLSLDVDSDEYISVSNQLFKLGQEFVAL